MGAWKLRWSRSVWPQQAAGTAGLWDALYCSMAAELRCLVEQTLSLPLLFELGRSVLGGTASPSLTLKSHQQTFGGVQTAAQL